MKAFDPVAEATTRWQSIEQHTSQALGRQAYHLGRSDEALLHFLALLVQRDNSEDTHDMDEGDQDIWDDFVLAFANLGPEGLATAGTGDSQLKARFFHPDRAEIILSSDSGSLTNDGCDWDDLELRALKLAREGLGKTISLQQRSPYRTVGIGGEFEDMSSEYDLFIRARLMCRGVYSSARCPKPTGCHDDVEQPRPGCSG